MTEGIKETHAYVHVHGMPHKGKVLMVLSSPSVSAQIGWPIGFWAAELTHPLHVFQEAGFEVVFASTEGGKVAGLLIVRKYKNEANEYSTNCKSACDSFKAGKL